MTVERMILRSRTEEIPSSLDEAAAQMMIDHGRAAGPEGRTKMSTKKRMVSKAEMGTAVRLAALLHAYDPGAFRSLSGPATEALRIMSTDGEARRMAIMLTDRIVAANRLVDALDAIADGEPARDVEVVSWAKAIRGLEEEANRASALATFLAELVTWKEAR